VSPIRTSVYKAGIAQGSAWGVPVSLAGMFSTAGLAPCGLSWTQFGDYLAMPDHFCGSMLWMRQGLEVAMGARCWPAHDRAAWL
jgi:hypothetical protein